MGKSQPDLSKQTKKPRNQATVFIEDRKSRTRVSMKRILTLKKKAEELAALCDVSVCVVCFGSDGKVDVWPEDVTKAKAIIMKYKENCSKGKRGILETMDMKLGKKVRWEKHSVGKQLHKLSRESLKGLKRNLESKMVTLDEKIRSLKEKSFKGVAQRFEEKLRVQDTDFENVLHRRNQYNAVHEKRSNLPGFNDFYGTNNYSMVHEYNQPSLPLGPATDSSYLATLMADDDQTYFTMPGMDASRPRGYYQPDVGCNSGSNSATNSAIWPLGYYSDVGCRSGGNSRSNCGDSTFWSCYPQVGCTTGRRNSSININASWGTPEINLGFGLRDNFASMAENHYFQFKSHTPVEVAQTNMGFGMAENFGMMQQNHNSLPCQVDVPQPTSVNEVLPITMWPC